MTTTEIDVIKNQFAERLKTFDKNKVNFNLYGLSEADLQILFEIGIPKYNGYGGEYIPVENLTLEEGKYLKIYTRKGEEKTYSEYINVNSNEIVFKNDYNEKKQYFYLNKNLESYLKYLQVYENYRDNYVITEKLGSYWGTKDEEPNHEKYAAELKHRFLEINDDVNKSTAGWGMLIEEMDLGVI